MEILSESKLIILTLFACKIEIKVDMSIEKKFVYKLE